MLQVADQGDRQEERIFCAIRTGEQKLGGSHFTKHRSCSIHGEGDERTDIREAVKSGILVGLEDGSDAAALRAQLRKARRLPSPRGPPLNGSVAELRLLVREPGQGMRNATGQMQIAAMGGGQQGVSLPIVQQHQRTAACNLAEPSNQSARNQGLGVDRLPTPVHVNMG